MRAFGVIMPESPCTHGGILAGVVRLLREREERALEMEEAEEEGEEAPESPGGGVTAREFALVAPELSPALRAVYLPVLNEVLIEHGINTPELRAAFLAGWAARGAMRG